jgi:C1A family cysteine protease
MRKVLLWLAAIAFTAAEVGCATRPESIRAGTSIGVARPTILAEASAPAVLYHGHATGGLLDRPTAQELAALHRRAVLSLRYIEPFHPLSHDKSHKATNMDPYFSWRDTNNVPDPNESNDQFVGGFCYVFAPVAALEANWSITHSGSTIAASEQHVINCIDGDGVRGGKASHAMRYLQNTGTDPATVEPYLTNSTTMPNATGKIPCNGTVQITYLADGTDFVAEDAGVPDPKALKQALIDRGPIACFIFAGGSFGNFFDNPNAANIVITDDSTDGNHFVLLTGWDDGRGAWQIRNSWGSSFGDHGYAWVKYGIRDITDNAMWIHTASN